MINIGQRIRPGFYAFGLKDHCMDRLKFNIGTPTMAQASAEIFKNEEVIVRVRRGARGALVYDCWTNSQMQEVSLDAFMDPITATAPRLTVDTLEALSMALQLLNEERR